MDSVLRADDGWLLRKLELLLIERDGARKTNYAEWHLRLLSMGFTRVWKLQDSLYGAFGHLYMAYQRRSRPQRPTCVEYANMQRPFPKCMHRTQRLHKATNVVYQCGSRLICLDPAVVNGSSEEKEIRYAQKLVRMGKLKMSLTF